MKKVITLREGKGMCYVPPALEQIDVQIEKGFAESYPGGDVESLSFGWTRYGDPESENE